MALVVYSFLVFLSFLTVSAGEDCENYYDRYGKYHPKQDCFFGTFCCGTCNNRYCCNKVSSSLSERQQEFCNMSELPTDYVIPVVIVIIIIIVSLFVCCCLCPCCCLYKMCRKPRPVIATTHTTVVTTPYPQSTTPAAQHYPGYQPVAPQANYGTPAGYGGQPMPMPSAPAQGPPYGLGLPPPYQESAGPGYPINYSQAAFTPGQPSYPLQPPAPMGYQTQPSAPSDVHASQPAYNPAYVAPPSKPTY